MNKIELGIRQAKLLVLKYKLECIRHHAFELEKEINTNLEYVSSIKHLYAAKADVLARVEADLKRIIDDQISPFEPSYLSTKEQTG